MRLIYRCQNLGIVERVLFVLQKIVITLVSATNGGRIDTKRNQFELTILPNDDPHGTVELAQTYYVVQEKEADSIQYIKLNRT